MSKNKRDGVKEAYYDPFNPGRRMAGSKQLDYEFEIERTLIEVALNRFKWNGLPDEIDPRFLELTICSTGLSIFFKEKSLDKYLAMQGTPYGPINLLGQYVNYRVQGGMGWTRELNVTECVPIWCNYTRVPDLNKIRIYAKRIASLDRTFEINAINARKSKYIAANERTRLSIENLNRMVEEGAAFLPVYNDDDEMLAKAFGVIDLGVAPGTLVDLDIARDRQWMKIMNLLGVNTSNQDKKERLVASETAANDDVVETIRRTNLNSREWSCEQMNRMFDLNVSVEYATDDTTAAQQALDAPKAPALKAVNE